MVYNVILKLKISRVANSAAKYFRKSLLEQIWLLVVLPVCDFEDLVILPFLKIFDHTSFFNKSSHFWSLPTWKFVSPSLLMRALVKFLLTNTSKKISSVATSVPFPEMLKGMIAKGGDALTIFAEVLVILPLFEKSGRKCNKNFFGV